MQFTEFNFSQDVLEGIRNAGFTECMPVQEEVYQHAMEEGKDVTVQSQTGSGKTAAFLLTIFEKFTRDPEAGHRALIVAPTRELAVQIEQEAQLLGGHLPLRVGCFHGGVSYGPQEKKLKEGVEIVIGTPGRLLDFARSKKLIMKTIDTVVIDEADRLFDMGFYPDIRSMLKMMKGPEERHTMLFSATISQRVGHLSWEFMNDPEAIVINPEQVTVEEITQEIYHVSAREKVNLLLGLLRREQPENALIFTNTKDMAVKLAKRLSLNGFHAKFIMGDLPQRKRMSIIKQIKEGELQLLVATDVAARGLHINDLDLVVNYDIPEDPESYVHRIGRTARVGKSGKAITLACEKYVYGLEAIEKFIDMKIPVQWADEELYQSEDKSAGVKVSGNRERGNDRKDGREQRGGGGRDKRSGGRSGQGRSGGQGRSSRDRSGDTARRNSDGGSGSRNRSRGGQSTSGRPAEHTAQTKAEKPGGKPGGKSGGQSSQREPAKAQASRKGDSAKGGSGKGEPHKDTPQKGVPEKSPSKDSDLNSRLAYYRKKYGEDFQLTDSTSSKKDGNGKENRRPAGGHAQKNKAQRKRSSDNGQSVKEREEAPVSGEEKKKKKGLISRLLGG